MIVRLMGEGQYTVGQLAVGRAERESDRATAAAEAGHETALDQALKS